MTALRNVLLVALASCLLGAAPTSAAETEPLLDADLLERGDAQAGFDGLMAAIEADPTDPRVPLALMELRNLWDLLPDGKAQALRRLEAVLPRAAGHWNGDGLRSVLVALRWARGDLAGALAMQEQRGLIGDFLVCGPFGLAPSVSLEEEFEPEQAANAREVDPQASFAALRGRRGWRLEPRQPLRGGTTLHGRQGEEGAVSYCLTHVRLDAPAEGYLVYRGPSAKLWQNRSLIAVMDRSRERLDRTLRVRVRLRAGWNRLLLKVGGGSSASFSLQAVDLSGAPLRLEVDPTPRGVEVDGAELRPVHGSSNLSELARGATPQRRALYAYGLLALGGLAEEALVELDDLRVAYPEVREQAWYLLLYARLAEQAEHLPASVRRELARRSYRLVLERDPRSVGARRRLAAFCLQDDQALEGVKLLEQVLGEQPGDLATRLQLVELLRRKRWLLAAERELDAAARSGPGLPPVLRARAELLEERGLADAAQQVREELLRLDPSQVWVLLRRSDAAAARGDAAAAREALASYSARAEAEVDDQALRRARLAAAMGDRGDELEALRQAVEGRPWDVGRRLTLARRLAEDALDVPAAREEAQQMLDELLAEQPELHAVRQLRDALRGQEDRFWEEWEPSLDEVLAGAPDRRHWPKASTVCLFDQQVTKVYPDASSVDVVHQIWRLLDESGVERYGSRPRSGDLLQVRTITPSGEVLEPIRAGNAFQMPGLSAGAVVEHAYRSQSAAPRFQFTSGPFYFQDPDLTEPFWLSRWVLMIHRDAPVRIVERNMEREGISKTVEERGEWVVTTYVARNQPRIQPEPNAPDKDEFLPWVKVVEERSLDQVGSLYRERAAARASTPSLARTAEELVFGLEGTAERARALYAFVQEHVTRPTGGDDAAEILAARGGSKTTLLRGLLDAARVPHDLLLAAPQPGDDTDWDHPEPGQFQIPVIRVAGEDGPIYVFAEGHKLAPYGQLPSVLWGASAFVCDPAGGGLVVLPGGGVSAEAIRSEGELSLLAGGAVRGRVRRVLPAYNLYRLKEVFGTLPEAQLRGWFAQQANELFPGAHVLETALPRREEPGAPLTIEFAYTADGVLRERGDGFYELRGLLDPSGLKAKFGGLRLRLFDLVLSDLWAAGGARSDVLRVDLGPYACPRLPRPLLLKNRFGQFSLAFSREGSGRLRVERQVLLQPGRVHPRDYPAFRVFLERIDQAERTVLELEARRRE